MSNIYVKTFIVLLPKHNSIIGIIIYQTIGNMHWDQWIGNQSKSIYF